MISMENYKSTLAEAEHIAAVLRAALARAGIAENQAARVRPLVTGAGRGYVELGALRVGDAHRLLDALRPVVSAVPYSAPPSSPNAPPSSR
ncbi:hypothetical protein [Streptomyces sp. BPTC-684]|uniref:hypothetical protein n=1 Tax=Streptomyces sp. BPTC-684 TaxID=3043734 RepID=UPI0024B1459D|nr:hypothetical protein [Streptomyces sp. BPTC-684]WHM38071.1 hypothetical protein QIY60_14875 [Streptomyces sp. BPTC-684]